MPATVWILIAIVALLLLGAAAFYAASRGQLHTRSLRNRFGREYDRTVEATGDQGAAERELDARQDRRKQFEIHDLEPEAQARYAEQWLEVQARFVDAPAEALHDADGMVTEIMTRRGYPMEDFEQMAADVSVDHSREVEEYRAAHAISETSTKEQASTEDMRLGIQHYRSLFESLLGQEVSTPTNGATTAATERLDESPAGVR
jgi:hypothetical protein